MDGLKESSMYVPDFHKEADDLEIASSNFRAFHDKWDSLDQKQKDFLLQLIKASHILQIRLIQAWDKMGMKGNKIQAMIDGERSQ